MPTSPPIGIEAFLQALRLRDIQIALVADRLRVDAPDELIDEQLKCEIGARKEEIVAYLRAKENADVASIPRRAAGGDSCPLSFAQEQLWAIDRLAPGNTAYTIPIAIRFRRVIDVALFEDALSTVVRRHEILRTCFVEQAGEPRQVVAEISSVRLPVTDLSQVPVKDREAAAQQFINEEAHQPFDLRRPPLFRGHLLRLGPDDWIFVLAIHHIIADGWSVGVLTRELASLYASGEPAALPALSIQYGDYSVWQRRRVQGAVLEDQLAYWKAQLAHPLPVLDLPTDHPRPPTRTARGAVRSAILEPIVLQHLVGFSRAQGATPFMVLLGGFVVLLHRWSGQSDIIVGTPFAGRGRPETEPLIGFFINTVALRTSLAGNPTFQEVVQRIRETSFGAHEHQDVPFEKILERVKPEPDPSRTPVFQVFFNLVDLPGGTSNLGQLGAEPFGVPELEAKFDLSIYVDFRPAGIGVTAAYNADLFDGARIEEALRQFSHVLEQGIASPDVPVGQLSLVTKTAQRYLPDLRAPLRCAWEGSLAAKVADHASNHPTRIAVEGEHEAVTYRELEAASNRLANALAESGVRPQEVVAIYASRDPALVVALLGVLKAGAAFLILDPAYPGARLTQCLSMAKPTAWLQLESAGPVPDGELSAYLIGREWRCLLVLPAVSELAAATWRGASESPLDVPIDPDGLAYLAFTSGTTGQPKGVRGTHRPLSHFFEWYRNQFALSPADRFAALSGLAHDPLLRDLLAPLWAGATLCVPTKSTLESPAELVQWLSVRQVTVLHLTPPMVEVIASGHREALHKVSEQLSAVRLACFGGDRLTRLNLSHFRQLAPEAVCVNFYGATETPQAMGYQLLPAGSGGTGDDVMPLGAGIADVQLLVLDPEGRLCGVGELGEIGIRTPYLSAGYHEDEAATADRFRTNTATGDPADRVYRTGDLGRYRVDGAVDFLGRADRQVKVRGFRIELAEVESVIGALPGVQEVLVQLRVDSPTEQRLVAYVVMNGSDAPTAADLRHRVAAKLPAYMVPAAWVPLGRLPRTPNGKLDLKALPTPDAQVEEHEFVGPRDLIESQLCKIWAEVLEIRAVSISSSFFDLGGHSLAAVRVLRQVEYHFGQRLTLATLLHAPTIEQLACVIREERPASNAASLVPVETRGNETPFFCVHGIGGNVLNFFELSRELGSERPFYALQSRGVDGASEPLTRIEDMAAQFLAEIRSVQPRGPYLLGGTCMGGAIAFAMACELQKAGEEVALLAFLDVPFPVPTTAASHWQKVASRSRPVVLMADLVRRAVTWWHLPPSERLVRFRRKTEHWKEPRLIQKVVADQREVASIARVQIANYWALRNYRPGMFTGRIVHYFSERNLARWGEDRRLAWSLHATEGQETHLVAGTDSGSMLSSPHVQVVGARLSEALAGASSRRLGDD